MVKQRTVKIAALADTHVGKFIHPQNNYEEVFEAVGQDADILLIGGDLTDHGLPEEAKQLVTYLKKCTIPKAAVLGNHDYTRGNQEEIVHILEEGGVNVLGEKIFEFDSVGFAGVKGFGGGFGKHMLGSFGEDIIKDFVKETIDEAEQLEISLDYIGRYEKKVVLLHYAPIPATNKGEPLEIYPFLGSSRFEEVVDRHEVSVVFHGHAHFGSTEGKTLKGIPVYNVSWPIMQKISPKRPYKVIEL